jgi:hemoglobin-like flavoprotein
MSQDPRPAAERPVDHAAADAMDQLLADLAEREHEFGERLYEIFFEARPDARPLFGVHAIAEREEMTKETLHSLQAWTEGEPWLRDNLLALGKSHWEYGVTADMYDSFVASMLACARAVLGESFDASRARAMHEALVGITRPMREAGDAAQVAAEARSARAGTTKAQQR